MWYMLRRGDNEIMTESKDRITELQVQGYVLISVVDINDVSKCKEG